MPFPRRANLTVTELLAFLPNSINCADVVYRMISNGGTRKSIYAIVNAHRALETEWSANCCGEAMYKTMQKEGYSNWTIKKHDLWHASQKALWDGNTLDVANLRIAHSVPAKSVSFRGLATDVRRMPEGDDALDLTRMVQYCVQKSEDGWRYPEDYEELLDLLGGPAEVREENTDGAVFRRWENRKPSPALPKPTKMSHGIDMPQRDIIEGRSRTRKGTPVSETRPTTLSPGPAVSLKNRMAVKKSTRAAPEIAADLEAGSESGEGHTPYIRELVSLVFEG
jgi:hypothetical protein